MLNEFIKRKTQQQSRVHTANCHHIRRGKKILPDRLYVRSFIAFANAFTLKGDIMFPLHGHGKA